MRNLLFATFTSFITIAGCAITSTDEQLDDEIAGKADAAARPSGTYTNPSPSVGELSTLTLNADYTYVRSELVECVGDGVFDCPPIEQHGTYKFTRSSAKRYIRFYDTDGRVLDRYQWKLVYPADTSAHLELNYDGDSSWFDMSQASANKHCGGWLGQTCGAGEYCDYYADSCGAADQSGICKPSPGACAQVYAPVCGCDHQTYGNACEAHEHGVDDARPGECDGI